MCIFKFKETIGRLGLFAEPRFVGIPVYVPLLKNRTPAVVIKITRVGDILSWQPWFSFLERRLIETYRR